MASTKNKTTEVQEKRPCTCCGTPYKNDGFYQSRSEINKFYGTLNLCKSCIEKIYEDYVKLHGDYKKAIYLMCRKLDVPFSISQYEAAIKQSNTKGTTLCACYFQKVNSIGGINKVGNCFDDSSDVDIEHVDKDKMNLDLFVDEENDYEITRDIIDFFGRGFTKSEYVFLSKEYFDWTSRYECDSKAMETLIKEICLTQLDIHRRRTAGEKVDQQQKTLQDLLGSSNLKPVQETGANSAEQATFGTLIKKWENERPIPEPEDDLKDVDGLKKYISIWFFGHLCKILNIDNAYSQMYDEEINKHTVEMDVDEEGSD